MMKDNKTNKRTYIALSQSSRNLECRESKRPMLADLRESGSLEMDADVVVSVFRDDAYDPATDNAGIAEICILKNRSGRTGSLMMLRSPETASFYSFFNSINYESEEPNTRRG